MKIHWDPIFIFKGLHVDNQNYILYWNDRGYTQAVRFHPMRSWYDGSVHYRQTHRHVFVKHGCPRRQQSQNMAKIYKSYILTPPNPQGHMMSVKCEEPIDELTVQLLLLYNQPNFKYCTLFVSGTELRTDRGQTDGQTDRQTDDPITRCPRRTFQAGA